MLWLLRMVKDFFSLKMSPHFTKSEIRFIFSYLQLSRVQSVLIALASRVKELKNKMAKL